MSTSLLNLHREVSRLPRSVDQVWSWVFATRVAALTALLNTPLAPACSFDWIEREMAWACEDLEEAGAHPTGIDVPRVNPGDSLNLVIRLLRIVTNVDTRDVAAWDDCGGNDCGGNETRQAQAVHDAVSRARACLTALAGPAVTAQISPPGTAGT